MAQVSDKELSAARLELDALQSAVGNKAAAASGDAYTDRLGNVRAITYDATQKTTLAQEATDALAAIQARIAGWTV